MTSSSMASESRVVPCQPGRHLLATIVVWVERDQLAIRSADRTDVPEIAKIRIAGWRTAYRGIVEDRLLDSLGVDADVAQYLAKWESGPTRRIALQNGHIVGFTAVGPYRMRPGDDPTWPGDETDGEIRGCYVAPDSWSTGVGRALIADALATLAANNHSVARLWVLAENTRARGFYTAAGFTDEEPRAVVRPFILECATRATLEVRYSRTIPGKSP